MRKMTRFVVMMVVVSMLTMLDDEALRPVEGQVEQAETVERRDEYADQHAQVRITGTPAVRFLDGLDDRVLRKEPGKPRHAGQRERTDPHRDVGDWHVAAQATHVAHVLLM